MGFFFQLELGKAIVVLLLCSVPDRIDYASVERLRKFNCSSPFRYFLKLLNRVIFLSRVMKFVFVKCGFASVK